jgi:hypothetical protein
MQCDSWTHEACYKNGLIVTPHLGYCSLLHLLCIGQTLDKLGTIAGYEQSTAMTSWLQPINACGCILRDALKLIPVHKCRFRHFVACSHTLAPCDECIEQTTCSV